MALIEWNRSLCVEISLFDQQHQELVSIINRLHQAIKEGQGSQILEEVFDQLVAYTQFHFKAEEELMLQYGYPDYEHHKREHVILVGQVADIATQIKAGKVFQPINVMQFLVNWLTNHLKGEDKQYSAFFKSKGVE